MITSYSVGGFFGFHTCHTVPIEKAYLEENAKADALGWNILNGIGYIPLVGLIPFAIRVVRPLTDDTCFIHAEPTAVRVAFYVRGIFEGLGLGLLFLIPDLVVTAY